MAVVYVFKSKRVKNIKDYTSKKFWSLGMFINCGKNVFSQPLPCKKNCSEICNIFYQQIFFLFILFYCDWFFLNTKLKIYKDSYFSVF